MREKLSSFGLEKPRNVLAFLLIFGSTAFAAEFDPGLHDKKCKNMPALAKEAIEYALVGAWMPFTTKSCIKASQFKFFKPQLGEPEGELLDPSGIKRFTPGKDSFKILKVARTDDKKEYRIEVEFKLGAEKLVTTYDYVPDKEYTGRTGICGFVTNPTVDVIRTDCFDKKKWDEAVAAAKDNK